MKNHNTVEVLLSGSDGIVGNGCVGSCIGG